MAVEARVVEGTDLRHLFLEDPLLDVLVVQESFVLRHHA